MEELQEKIEAQKQLIIKAKAQIDKLRREKEQLIDDLKIQTDRNMELEKIVQGYLEDGNKLECERVLAKIKIEEIEWLCIRNHGVEWIRQSEFDKFFSPSMHEELQLLDYNKSKDDVLVVVQQYEQRIKGIQEENQQNELKIQDLKKKLAEKTQEIENEKNEILQSIIDIIQQSESMRENCLLMQESSLRQDCETKIKFQLLQLQKVYTYVTKVSNPLLVQLKQHIIMMNQTLFEITRNTMEITYLNTQLEKEHKQTLKQIEEERQLERLQRQQHFENGRQHIQGLEQQIETLMKEIREKQSKIELMQQDSKQNVNIQYIKNIIIRFFTEEQSVKQKTIPVIATVLQFTDQEQQIIQQGWDQSQKSLIGRIFSK